MSRDEAWSDRGMVASQHPLAVDAALAVLDEDGTAVDAAVAAAAVLTVVDPRSTGLGGDLFALCWPPGASGPTGLEAVGVSPGALTVERLRALGHERMPIDGPLSITVPGAPAGWEHLLGRYGRLDTGRILAPSIAHARSGFEVTPAVAAEWTTTTEKLGRNAAAAATFLIDGRPPRAGERFAVPELATTLERFAEEGSTPFYHGELAERTAAAVTELGGLLQSDDLAAWAGPGWVEPLRTSFRGLDVHQMPPPGQGIVVLEALRIYQALDPRGPVEEDHAAIEAVKLAYEDANEYLGDPELGAVPVDELLSDAHVARQVDRVRPDAALVGDVGRPSNTVYVAVADRDGGACSLIQSLYEGFGSGVVVPGTGITLQNRGSGFTFRNGHPNQAGPRKRPFHTIIPAMLGEGPSFRGCLGVVGAYMQTQGQLQVLRGLLDRGLTVQEACDAPRFRVYRGRDVAFEDTYPAETISGLRARGHVPAVIDPFERGGAQMILVDSERGYRGGSDHRKDGHATGR